MVTKLFRSPCRKPAAVLVRWSPGRRRGEERSPRWATTQPCQVHTSRRACSVGNRLIFHGTKCAWADNYYISSPVPPTCREVGAVEPRPTAWGGERPALGHITTTQSLHCEARVLRGWSADIPRGETRACCAPQHPTRANYSLSYPVPPTCRGVGTVEPRPTA